jgi:putative phosphoesterase
MMSSKGTCPGTRAPENTPVRTIFRVGLISDTHGLLRPEAMAFLKGCDYIVHGGDIGHNGSILEALAALAPVTAVRGNNDTGGWAKSLCEAEYLKVGELIVYVIHDLAQLDIDPLGAGVRVVVSGHSHKPLIEERDGVLYVNPGSSGPRRFKLPVTVADLRVAGKTASARLVDLEERKAV